VGWQSTGSNTVESHIQALEQSILQQTSTRSGSVAPVYPIENVVLGGMVGKGASALLGAILDGTFSGTAGVVGAVENANFAQKAVNASGTFSADGAAKYTQMAGVPINTIDDLASAIRSGLIQPSQLPVDYVLGQDGTQLILNTRTSVALDRAGIPKSQWYGADKTGVQVPGMPAGTTYNDLAAAQLSKNKLPATGLPTIPRGPKS
jgi:filamentous hemagglutinin